MTSLLVRRSAHILSAVMLAVLLWLPAMPVLAVAVLPPSVGASSHQRSASNMPNTIEPNVYSGDVLSLQISTPPLHGTAEVRGLKMVYTPRQGFVGSDRFSYTATGIGGVSQSAQIHLNLTAPALSRFPALANGFYGSPYTRQMHTEGGSEPYRYELLGGGLPAGLSMDADGWIRGTPQQAGEHVFTVRVVDAWGY